MEQNIEHYGLTREAIKYIATSIQTDSITKSWIKMTTLTHETIIQYLACWKALNECVLIVKYLLVGHLLILPAEYLQSYGSYFLLSFLLDK